MKKLIAIAVFVSLLALGGCAQSQTSASSNASPDSAVSASAASQSSEGAASAESTASAVSAESADSLVIHVGDMQFAVAPADTDAARALIEQLQAGPVTVSLHAYGGFEQVGPLPWGLPASDEQITTLPGDVMLYQGNQITIFTGSNSWAYTPLGSIEGATPEALFEAFGGETAEITLSLA